ncbi:MAG: SNF2 helicase associated domain-containing protein [Clostridiales bacterium]|nr:SNF2 helicase associated domain-containing protein [Clostridiales bacterium]MCF8023186.1 SNF2 helicase associated domain-containing protein [Clostridiales bacterium]
MHSLTEEKIKDTATNLQVYLRGQEYYRKKRVINFEFSEESLCARGIVAGSDEYDVEACFSEDGDITGMYCDCPAFAQFRGACKHVVALLEMCRVEIANKKKMQFREQNMVNNILEYFEHSSRAPQKRPLKVEFILDLSYDDFGREIIPSLSLKLGEKRLYVVRNLKQLLQAIKKNTELALGKHFTFSPLHHTFHPEDEPVIDLLSELYEIEKSTAESYHSWHQKLFKGKHVFLPGTTLNRLLSILPRERFILKLFGEEYNNVQIVEEDLPLHFTLDKDKEKNELVLQWKGLGPGPLLHAGEHIFCSGKFYKTSERQRNCFIPLLNAFIELPDGIRFSREQQERFVTQVLPEIKQTGQVDISPEVQNSIYDAGLKTEIYLDRVEEAVTASINFAYGEIKINPYASDTGYQAGDKILLRDTEQESVILNLFEKAKFRAANKKLYLEEEEKIYEFVYHILPEMQEKADIYYSEKFRNMRVRSSNFTGSVNLNEESEMLEFSFQMENIDTGELADIFKALREKKRYHRLKDGSFLPLENPGSDLHEAVEIVDSLNIPERQLKQDVVEIPKNKALFIDSALQESQLELKRNAAFEELVQDITGARHKDFEIPEIFKGVLRNYQETGFKWLKTLAGYGFGGILADDMGLGKTIQAIAFIVSEREKQKLPALVIAPTSMVYNWQDEAQKFAPGLEVTVVAGTPRQRKMQLQEARNAALVITSYALIRRDIEMYQEFNFSCCFLDEAQHIKNPGALGAKTVKQIKAGTCFALTGTPLENNLTELWSIFDFIMPGYLFTRREFSKRYEKPVVKEQDQKALQKLQKQITPFILRRMKKDVLQELPPKFESKVPADLTTEQKKVYLTYLQQAKGEIEEAVASQGWEKSQIKILSALTRLRQVCCHPATFLENYTGDSGKLQNLKEIMQNAVESGHRILLFSQFTAMLGIIRQHLDKENISYFYLDGSTKAEKRGEMVRSFNEGQRQAFLISLKAGGTGLNLTGADMVIHYDPWWNPAVEEQATDRAYRIGQKNSVQVINLVTRGTIEEKIYELQQKKKDMINSVIKPGETMLAKMTEQEIRELLQ